MTRLPPSAVVQTVRTELAIPGRYHLRALAARRSFFGDLFTWVWDHVVDFFNRFFAHVHVGSGTMNAIGMFVVVLCAIAFAGVALSLALRVQLGSARRAGIVPMQTTRSARAYALEAAQYAGTGDYARAVRALFLASVAALDVGGIVVDERGATVNELRRALSQRNAHLEQPFTDLARAYTNAAYAERPLERSDYERAALAYVQLEKGLGA
jgi:hypothetical protein